MKKSVALTSAMLGLAAKGMAHVSGHTETQPETGFHATPIEIGIIVVLAVIGAGMIYIGFDSPEVEEDEE